MEPEKQREGFGSRLGFILVSAGCAIGIGNVWRFPTVTGQYGGGIFVFFYLIFLVLMGLPVLTMELAVGRAGHGAARSAYKALEPQGSKWHIHGWFCMVGCILLMMYYTTVSGWMLDYFFRFLTGNLTALRRNKRPASLARCSRAPWKWCSGWSLSRWQASSSAAAACKAAWKRSANG